MTCFFDGIIDSLDLRDFRKIGLTYKPAPLIFAKAMKENNKITEHVVWQGVKPKDKELRENYDRIKSYDLNTIMQGYDCSSSEPFLFLVSELFKVKIEVNFIGSMIYYNNIEYSPRTFKFANSRGHFRKI